MPKKPKKQTYEIGYTWWEATVEIDPVKAKKPIKHMVEFWSGWEDRLERNNGNYTAVFLKQLATELLFQSMQNIGFDPVASISGHEGYVPMDGSAGIRIIHCDRWRWETEDIEVRRV